MKITVAIIALIAGLSPSMAWDVGHFKDAMTDRQETFATVTPKGVAGDAGVRLYVGCTNGQVMPRLTFARPIGVYDIGVTYRYDDGPLVPRIARLDRSGETVWAWDANEWSAMRRAKRLRVQIGGAVMDFDLTAGGAVPGIRCR